MSNKPETNAFSRRDFLKGSAASALGLAAMSVLGTVSFAEETEKQAVSAAPEKEAFSTMEGPLAKVKQGTLRGYMDGKTYAFLGVPYAKAGRFEKPAEPDSWEGVRLAQSYGFVCPIPAATSVGKDEFVWPHRYWIEGEDCQNLNIWTQSLDPAAKRPVMVYYHGGGFNNGSSIEGAAQEGANLSSFGDVVVVTVNHRLNVLGFLDLSDFGPEYENSINLGVDDLVASLKWVKENIAAFGGDPDCVTIFGQSGGGRKVMSLLRAPEAKGLFHRAIVESTSLYKADKETAACIRKHLMENLGVTDVEGLKKTPIRALEIAAADAVTQAKADGFKGATWAPLLDDKHLMKDICDWAADIPVLIGTTFAEQGSTFNQGDGRKNEWSEEETMANLTAKYGDSAKAIAEEFGKVFPDKKTADVYFYDGSRYRKSLYLVLNELNGHQKAPCYAYLFSYEAPVNGGTVAYHCNELIYVYHNVTLPIVTRAVGGTSNKYALTLQDTIAQAWVNFAATGNPSQPGLEWKPFTQAEPNMMRFDVECKCAPLGDEKLNKLIQDALA